MPLLAGAVKGSEPAPPQPHGALATSARAWQRRVVWLMARGHEGRHGQMGLGCVGECDRWLPEAGDITKVT